MPRPILLLLSCLLLNGHIYSQKWQEVTSRFGELPDGFEVFQYSGKVENRPFIGYLVRIDLKNKQLECTTDTTFRRRLTPSGFYKKNDNPLLVVNGTFFDFASNRNLNVVIRKGKLLSYNVHSQQVKGSDSASFMHSSRSAIGISARNEADVAWLFADTTYKRAYSFQEKPRPWKDGQPSVNLGQMEEKYLQKAKKWKVRTAIGGGPVLIQNGQMAITNDEERMFTGKARYDLHPRTAMGYTADGKLIILAVEGRRPGKAEGASLPDLAKILLEFGCLEALNLDGGGSSCLLINGKETIQPSDKEGQRAVPAVFIVKAKN